MNPTDFPLVEAETEFRHPRMEELLEVIHNHTSSHTLEEIREALSELAGLLPEEDDQPAESPWHRAALNLLIDILVWHWRERHDLYLGGNMFRYYFKHPHLYPMFCGPDFFFVAGVERPRPRDKWVHWLELKFPQVVIELSSRRTAQLDRTTKKDFYERRLEVDEYLLYDPVRGRIEGWRLNGCGRYETIPANERGWLWSEGLQLWLGSWKGKYLEDATWPRFYDAAGNLIPTNAEAATHRADAMKALADEMKNRADALEREGALLRERLAQLERNTKNG